MSSSSYLNPIHYHAAVRTSSLRGASSDRHAVAEEFVIFVVAPFTGAKVGIVMHELNGRDPLDHLETDLVLAT